METQTVAIPAASRLTPLKRALNRARDQGVPAAAVASEAEISAPHLSLLAAGRSFPSAAVADRIAAALGEPVEALFPNMTPDAVRGQG